MAPVLVRGVPHVMEPAAAVPCRLHGQVVRVERFPIVHAWLVADSVLACPMVHALNVVTRMEDVDVPMERAEGRHEEEKPYLHELVTVHGASGVLLLFACLSCFFTLVHASLKWMKSNILGHLSPMSTTHVHWTWPASAVCAKNTCGAMPADDPVPMKTVMGHCVSAWRPSSWLGHWYLHCRSHGNLCD